ncbi:MAG TPA: hypothetical protein DCZ95_15935 [Verrucomicrobia bacterium]|nr:hypothetical protein [Verrucomicrobiota bacterium]
MSSGQGTVSYNDIYLNHQTGKRICQESIHNLEKACRRVRQVFRFFCIRPKAKASALDVGCGLGFYTSSLSQLGYAGVGIDQAVSAIDCACSAFPEVSFKCASYPDDVQDSFDLIWAVDVSILNTFDVSTMVDFLDHARSRLKPSGWVVIGWHTDFSGTMKRNWAHWDWNFIKKMRKVTGLMGPAVVQTRFRPINHGALQILSRLEVSTPVFFALKAK